MNSPPCPTEYLHVECFQAVLHKGCLFSSPSSNIWTCLFSHASQCVVKLTDSCKWVKNIRLSFLTLQSSYPLLEWEPSTCPHTFHLEVLWWFYIFFYPPYLKTKKNFFFWVGRACVLNLGIPSSILELQTLSFSASKTESRLILWW